MDSRVAFIITLAGTGVNGREIAVKQNQYFSENKKDAAFAKIAHEIILNEPDFLLRKKKIWQAVNDFYGRFNLLMKIQFLFAMNITASEWNRFFIMYDPAEAFEKVTCPVLALNGEYDIQVLPQDNLAAIEEALKKAKNTDYTTMVIPKANHLFQIVESGGPKPYSKLVKEYATTEQTITPEVLEIMTEWIIKRYLIAKK